jgi:DNA-binding GntR family transcriptional regulator
VSSAERAYLHTKHLIIRGDLAGGQLISEGQICEEMGISRTPVHEAFLRLAAEQLLVLSSRKGAVVAPMSPREVHDLAEMRAVIEGAAAVRIVREGGLAAADLAHLSATLDRQRAAVQADDADAFIAADDEFHSGITEAGNNPIALHFFGQLRDRQQRIRNQLLRLTTRVCSSCSKPVTPTVLSPRLMPTSRAIRESCDEPVSRRRNPPYRAVDDCVRPDLCAVVEW